MSGQQTSATDHILALIAVPRPLPPEWAQLAGREFADTVAVLIAGSAEPVVASVAATIDETGGSARSLATGAAMSGRSAALLDGTAAHALDYDDVDEAVIAHPSAVLVPALLTAGVARDVSGADLATAYRVGVRVDRLLAAAIGIRDHYDAGWHSTSTIGTIGTAAAIASLWDLPSEQCRHAIGIAGSLAAGSRQNFGTMTKPLHAGIAASNGLLAAQLASRGLTSDTDVIDGHLGFLRLHGADAPLVDLSTISTDHPALNVKLFPCCYYAHRAAEAALESSTGTAIADIVGVEVVVQPGGLAPLIHHRPQDGVQAKFSMEYVVAAALIDRRIERSTFEDDRVRLSDVQRLLERVSLRESPTPPVGPVHPGEAFAVVTVRRGDGTSTVVRVDRPVGHALRPLTDEQLRHKFDDCTASADPEATHEAYQALRELVLQTSTRTLVEKIGRMSASRSEENV
ncbi:MmgE/PrpD family protein [Rhodococcus erythropolis]|uniref:MmgE/PrpD family protein n=1 Tax=Rhodococcus erythropolis TaxID=1833 RepID=UPI00294A7C71|nr:MmgE/PrpD family protein [Rhodococcus erythropolis]MDV6212750.1 MmgE/PrpD family protein [Rhodococcus erythropolis]